MLNILYLYIAIGIIFATLFLVSYKRNENNITETVNEKIHKLRNDGSFSYNSANIIGHLLAFIVGVLFWPILVVKKILGQLGS